MGFKPLVHIVGAGPGDPGLLTVRGRRCLSAADVVVHDHLVHARILGLARPECERIDVGAAAPKPLEQDAICLLIAQKAAEGRVVVRLKWGDPFVFDSGGKEALFLHEQGIPFEVVPGVPAAVATSCYAGIPITYPHAGDALALVRGFEDESRTPPHVNWAAMAQLDGPVVCYAGARQVASIANALLNHGRDRGEPVAIVFDGTLPTQQTLQSTLGEIAEMTRRFQVHRPGLLIVGRVANLREYLRWFDARPLFGKRIVVTRSREQAGELVEMLEDLGADAIEAPTIRIAPADDFERLDAACREAGTYDWIVFTSANGVDHFMRRLLAGPGDVRDLKGPRLCTIGPATAERLARYGIKVDLMPVEYRAEAVVEALREHGDVSGRRILLPRADLARELLAEELRREGAEVTEVAAYRTLLETPDSAAGPDIYRLLLDGQIDVVTFTSASTVRSFTTILGPEAAMDLLRTTDVACIGPVTAAAAEQLGIRTTIMPSKYTIPALVEAVVDHVRQRSARQTAAGAGSAGLEP